ncbi:crotonobetainyl-CoA:carnitine CoA-transferase CaiB-like acyl-CoA transferase [Rhizobium sp. PP-F2F-G48]|uniref:CaiB/BaiF CoA transferase family protein n=1 Tax=Rhizobium sp. PP-F2F-G48 TaxID=2135651 RepID=UPI00104C6611|nr:CaiB/BaiF CoA-transferase family protein [Rhizobium sp. PP-F2F-G48]TCM46506.1 crotonobetainyl-CoA:carnitine CoA-transferase CaiB-like acyl-CoA transferase [Rhizobium sp. PP-F2F-G48]
MTGEKRLPLEGINVISIEQAVAAPFCSARLADAGAQVIKIERPEGDFARGYDDVCAGQSSYFVWLNRGKNSLVVDLATTKGKQTLAALLAKADILIQNLKPGALDRMGFGAQKLRQTHPRLIICSISGYGETGPMAHRKAYDLLLQAECGLSSVTGGPEAPARVGISVVDIATGSTAYSAILEALLARAVTGEGAYICVSMFDVMADWLTVPLLHQEGGKAPKRLGLAHPSIAPYGVFTAKDGMDVLIAIQSDREWARFCTEFLQKPEMIVDLLFAKNVLRVKNRAATDDLVASVFATIDASEAERRLIAADTAFASVNDMAALSAHPHLRRIIVETPAGPVAYPAPAPIFVGEARSYGSVPAIGERSRPEFAEIGS